MARERARARRVPTLQELSYFWTADFTAATPAWSGLALRLDLPIALVAELASDDGELIARAVRFIFQCLPATA